VILDKPKSTDDTDKELMRVHHPGSSSEKITSKATSQPGVHPSNMIIPSTRSSLYFVFWSYAWFCIQSNLLKRNTFKRDFGLSGILSFAFLILPPYEGNG
jgi:hypothetical protein